MTTRIAIIGDFNPANESHAATNASLNQCAAALNLSFEHDWIGTDQIAGSRSARVADASGLWIAPASPYRNMDGALAAIRAGRELGIPVLGTCGGFQHIILEYARNVLGMNEAEHGESASGAAQLVISRLACSLAGRTMTIRFAPESRLAKTYGTSTAREGYYCNFGVNPEFVGQLFKGKLRAVASDDEGTVRAVELTDHPFFIGTLFLPQFNSSAERPHPLITAFLTAAARQPMSGLETRNSGL